MYTIYYKALLRYGGIYCSCCGFSRPEALTLVHTKNNMRGDRKFVNERRDAEYQRLDEQNYPPGYKVLCMNCSLGRWENDGICPHEEERQANA